MKSTKTKLIPKIAIFHNFMDNIGGAEILSLTLAQELDADFYSTNIDRSKIKKMGFENVRLESIGRIGLSAPWRQQLALHRFRKLDLKDKYDAYIISGDWAVSATVNHQPVIWYAQSPIREIWDLYKQTRKNNVPKLLRNIFDLWVKYNRYLNKKYANQATTIVANSTYVQKKIYKYLGQKSEVIHPPINTRKYHYEKNGDYWLSVNRLIDHKRVEIQLEAFSKMPKEKLIIVGSYEQSKHFKKYTDKIKKIKPANVRILSWIDQAQLTELYANCKGFITTAKDEDFGMTVVEAMASGKPVIAPNEGGYRETLIHNVTGELIDNIDEYKLRQAIKRVGRRPDLYKDICLKQAQKFDTKIFIEKIKTTINNIVK